MYTFLDRLTEKAIRAETVLHLGRSEYVVVCVEVDDARWRYVVNGLMPDTPESYWQAYRDKGEEPVALGSAMFSLCNALADEMPDLVHVLQEVPPEGYAKAIILAEGGCTVYDIPVRPN